MNDWNNPAQREIAFKTVIAKAMTDQKVKAELLNSATAQTKLETLGEIKLPEGMTVQFVEQKDIPNRLVMMIPADPPIPNEEIVQPGFATCFKGLWITYSSEFQAFQRLLRLANQSEIKNI